VIFLSLNPFFLLVMNLQVEVVKILLRTTQTELDVNRASSDSGCTALWWAAFNGDVEMVKWLIGLRGEELDAEAKGKWFHKEYSPLEIALVELKEEAAGILRKFKDSKNTTVHEIRQELQIV